MAKYSIAIFGLKRDRFWKASFLINHYSASLQNAFLFILQFREKDAL